jgi:hypothetical protein
VGGARLRGRQRAAGRFRNVTTAFHHATVNFDGNARMFGRTVLGLDPGTPLV